MAQKRKKAAALLLCAVLVLAALFADVFLARAVGHECTGTDCPICACVAQIAGQFKASAGRAVRPGAAALRAPLRIAVAAALCCAAVAAATPVAQGVRLND